MKTDKPRFKIDTYPFSSANPVGLYYRSIRPVCCFGFFAARETWTCINIFETRDKARAAYDAVKDLPEYLD